MKGKRLEIKAGDTFGKWTVLEEVEPKIYPSGRESRMFRCVCECGTIKTIKISGLTNGTSRSCGCLMREKAAERATRHGFSKHPLFPVYWEARHRCESPTNKDFQNYGGRGIKFCEEWKQNPSAFFEWADRNGYKQGLQLDRKNNDGDYCPENCHFVSPKENARNRRITTRLEDGTPLLDVYDRAVVKRVSYTTFAARVIRYGWDIQKALHEPAKKIGVCHG